MGYFTALYWKRVHSSLKVKYAKAELLALPKGGMG